MKDTEFERLSKQLTNRQPNFEWSETVDNTKDRIRMELFKDVYVATVSRGEGLVYSREMAKNAIISFDNIFKEQDKEE